MTTRTDNFDEFAKGSLQFVSLGMACQHMQVMPRQLKTLMGEAQIGFSLVLDGVGYFSLEHAELLVSLMAKVKQELADRVQAAPQN